MNATSFGAWLKARRQDRGLTQTALADMIGVTQPQVSRYEDMGEVPSAVRAGLIADALGVTVYELVDAASTGAELAGASGPPPPETEERDAELRRWQAIEAEAQERIRRLQGEANGRRR